MLQPLQQPNYWAQVLTDICDVSSDTAWQLTYQISPLEKGGLELSLLINGEPVFKSGIEMVRPAQQESATTIICQRCIQFIFQQGLVHIQLHMKPGTFIPIKQLWKN